MYRVNGRFLLLAIWRTTLLAHAKQVRFCIGVLTLLLTMPAGAQSTATVFEFYHTTLDHYFRTSDVGEATGIDNGAAGPGWVRTGDNFLAYPANNFPTGAAPVCRFYGSVNPGPNSHFYTSDKTECDGLKALQASTPATQKRWNYEGIAFAIVPGAGTSCASNLKPVYRLYNNGHARGEDSNHRYTTLQTEYTRLQTGIWKGEGVVMCASSQGSTEPPVNPLPPPSTTDSSSCATSAALRANGATYQRRVRGTLDGSPFTEELDYRVTTGANFQGRSMTELKTQGTHSDFILGTSRFLGRDYYEMTGSQEIYYGHVNETVVFDFAVNFTLVYIPPQVYPRIENIGNLTTQTYSVVTTQQSGDIDLPFPPTNTQFTARRKFVGFERVTVPAGTFNACKFEHTSTGGGVSLAWTVWTYAGGTGAGIELKYMTTSFGLGASNSELVSATLPGGGALPPN